MDILVLGGTGAMGAPLVEILSKRNDRVFVTTRSEKNNTENVVYIKGNAKDEDFFNSLMNRNYDVIIDFMVYNTIELKKRIYKLLDHTDHYFFFSSSRCYADSAVPITESSSRLVDVCKDEDYLAIDEYGMAKGREENVLFNCEKKNWTIIRPYITYNAYRIQLGVYEKEDWLRRSLAGRTIVFPKDIASKKTSLTYGPDVAKIIAKLIGNEKAYGEAFHITTSESHTWEEILNFYCDKIESNTGKRPKVLLLEDSKGLQKVWNQWQIKYDRLYNRTFDNSKIGSVIGKFEFRSTFEGLGECLDEFLTKPKWLNMNILYEAWCDRQSKEITPLKEISGLKKKIRYIQYRFLSENN